MDRKSISALLTAALLCLALGACGTAAPATPPAGETGFAFSAADREGNVVDETLFSGSRLIMLNFWEPWCPPCVGEMPDLEKLYEAYKEKGFLIVGVYSADNDEASVDEVLSAAGTSYPILRDSKDFAPFRTGYVPTSVFFDSGGRQISELLIGSRSYTQWEELVRKGLGEE